MIIDINSEKNSTEGKRYLNTWLRFTLLTDIYFYESRLSNTINYILSSSEKYLLLILKICLLATIYIKTNHLK